MNFDAKALRRKEHQKMKNKELFFLCVLAPLRQAIIKG
jgi:hypothetical protein